MRISLLLAVLALALGACDGTTDDDFTPQLVVGAVVHRRWRSLAQ